MEGPSRRSPRAASLPLQFRQASSRIEIWTGSQNSSLAGWVDRAGADTERSLLIEDRFSGVEECHIRGLLLDPSGHPRCSRSGSGSLTTIDDGSTGSLELPYSGSRANLQWQVLASCLLVDQHTESLDRQRGNARMDLPHYLGLHRLFLREKPAGNVAATYLKRPPPTAFISSLPLPKPSFQRPLSLSFWQPPSP